MRRLGTAAVLATLGCTPDATLVGAWTSETTGAPTPGSSGAPSSPSSSSDDTTSTTSSTDTSSGAPSTESSSTGAPAPRRWVLTLGADLQIQLVDIDSGELAIGCTLTGERPDALALLPDGRLVGVSFASSAMWHADPCDCAATPIPAIFPPLQIRGLADLDADPADIVVADTNRAELDRVDIDGPSVIGTVEMPQIVELAALASRDGTLHALLGAAPVRLVALDLADGSVQSDVPTSIPADAQAFVEIPGEAAFVACDPSGAFWRVASDDGTTTAMVAASPDPCHVLARPHAPIACLDALFGS